MSFTEYLRLKIIAELGLTEFYNKCHAEDGKFCEIHGESHNVQSVGKRLATAKPTAKGVGKNKGKGSGELYRPGEGAKMSKDLITDDMLKDKKAGPGLITRQTNVPGFEDLKGRTDRAVLDEIITRQADNIEEYADFVLSNSRKVADETADWYPFSNHYMTDLAKTNGVSSEGAIAATAVLSASAAWESNVPWAKYLVENMGTNKGPNGGINQKVDPKWVVAAFLSETAAGHNPDPQGYAKLIGNRLHELTDSEIALVLRGKHDASGTFVPKTGKFSMGEVRQLGEAVHAGFGKEGAGTIPQSQVNIAKAISVLRDPSPENIDRQIGNQNKVRSFYQNMRDPKDTKFEDVTVDTHHFGIANGMPWTISSRFIESGTNNVSGAPGNKETGALGTYPLVVEATREATRRINKKYGTNYTPNQIQSIVWEHHKRNYPPSIRDNQEMQANIEGARSAHALYLKTGGQEGISKSEMDKRIDSARVKAGGPTIKELQNQYKGRSK